MYVLVSNNSVINGPRGWNYYSFQSTITDDLGLDFQLNRDDPGGPVVIDANNSILPAIVEYPPHNPKIQYCHGPFWDFSNNVATASYQVLDSDLNWVKGALKPIVAANRYNKEISGTTATVQNTTVTIDTSRDGRNIFIQKYLLMGDNDTVQWKFPEAWLTLTKADLGNVVAAGATYIQNQFTWEVNKAAEIDACQSLAEVDAVVLEP